MNHVERFRAVMDFQPVDRLPRIEWAGWWDKTIERWRGEGLPELDRYETYQHLGLDPYWQGYFPPYAKSCPQPERHGAGIAATADDYCALRRHLFPPVDDTIKDLMPWAEAQERGEGVMWVTLEGFFWFPRYVLGIENHLFAFYDRPELMHELNQDLADFNVAVAEGLAKACRPAFMTLAEDMSYNNGPMLSKQLFDEFLAPYYKQVTPILKEMGTYVIVDSDGDVAELMPWLDEVGVEGILPLERQAGADVAMLRKANPRFRFIGNFDKMVMNKGEDAMRNEFERLLPAMRLGGFIPSVDHQTPPGVSLAQYKVYLQLLKEYTEKAVR